MPPSNKKAAKRKAEAEVPSGETPNDQHIAPLTPPSKVKPTKRQKRSGDQAAQKSSKNESKPASKVRKKKTTPINAVKASRSVPDGTGSVTNDQSSTTLGAVKSAELPAVGQMIMTTNNESEDVQHSPAEGLPHSDLDNAELLSRFADPRNEEITPAKAIPITAPEDGKSNIMVLRITN